MRERGQPSAAEAFSQTQGKPKKRGGFHALTAGLVLAGAIHGAPIPQQSYYEGPTTSISASVGATSSAEPFLRRVDGVEYTSEPSTLSARLADARRRYVREQERSHKVVKAYEVEQDTVVYKVLASYEGSSEYTEAKSKVDSYIQMQLETHLGERLHVGLSQIRHTIVDGELRVADTSESLLAMLKNGRDFRREHGKAVDWDREEAEVLGFERIQKKLTDPNTPVGTMMFFVSPPGDVENGSIYYKNFYDVFLKKSQTEVVTIRYTSGLTPEESHERLKKVDSRYRREQLPTDAEMIANPVEIEVGTSGFSSPDDIHRFMHIDHKYTSRDRFALVIQACQPLIDEYKQALTNEPDNIARHKKILDMIMNHADNVYDELAAVPEEKVIALLKPEEDIRPWFPPQIDRDALALQEVRITQTGCGSSGGESSSAFSVAEHASNKDGGNCSTCHQDNKDNHYHCPGCSKKYADETHAEKRTEECRCGFKFGC